MNQQKSRRRETGDLRQEEKERVAFVICDETGCLNLIGESMIFKFCDSFRIALSGFQRESGGVISYEYSKESDFSYL